MNEFTHIDSQGNALMVDVGAKPITERIAIAQCAIRMLPSTLALIENRGFKKGDVLGIAQLAGIIGAKKTSDLIPLCHPLGLTSAKVELTTDPKLPGVQISATCKIAGKTGVEMEALTAVSVSALTVYDMCKAIDKGMVIEDIRLIHKSGGRSGEWSRQS